MEDVGNVARVRLSSMNGEPGVSRACLKAGAMYTFGGDCIAAGDSSGGENAFSRRASWSSRREMWVGSGWWRRLDGEDGPAGVS